MTSSSCWHLSLCKSHEFDVFKAGRGAVAEWVGTMGVFAESMRVISV